MREGALLLSYGYDICTCDAGEEVRLQCLKSGRGAQG